MSSNRHSLPSTFEHYGVVDFLAAYDDFDVLKSLKQLPFDQGDFSLALPRIVQRLERSAPPPLALPKNWLGDATKDNSAEASNPVPVLLYSQKREGSIPSSETLPVGISSDIQTEGFAPAAGAPLPKIPAKSSKRAEHVTLSSSSASSSLSDAGSPPPQTETAKDPAMSRPGTINHRRQLSSAFVRGQRLPFSIVEEDEPETSESCYSTDEGATSSESQHTETDALSQQKSHTQSSSTNSDHANQPCYVSTKQRPSRAHLIKNRMKRMLSTKAPRTRVQGQLV